MKSGLPKLILLCGLPGAGKSTLSIQLAKDLSAVRLCPDEWLSALEIDLFDNIFRDRLEIKFWEHAKNLLELGQTVILESGFWLRSDRDEKRLGARALEVPIDIYYLDIPIEERMRRLNHRQHSGDVSAVVIERHQLEHWGTFFQAPDQTELDLFDNHTIITAKPTT
jgi:predicted kinase